MFVHNHHGLIVVLARTSRAHIPAKRVRTVDVRATRQRRPISRVVCSIHCVQHESIDRADTLSAAYSRRRRVWFFT
jgi:hypothetical protein